MTETPLNFSQIRRFWNRTFYQPVSLAYVGFFRIAYAILLFMNMAILAPDLMLWFGESGVLPYEASRKIIDPDTITIFGYLPQSDSIMWTCYLVFLAQIVALGLGFFSRFQAACVFFWLVSFQNRNILLWDGEDTVFRLFAFLLIFMPLGAKYSLDRLLWRERQSEQPSEQPVWALGLIRIQMTLIYASTAWQKLKGQDWIEGTSMYYVARLDDLFGRYPLPMFFADSMFWVIAITWATLAFEVILPFALWFKETRRYALVAGFLFHFALDYSMNLLLFHWVMSLGLSSFVNRSDVEAVKSWWRARFSSHPSQSLSDKKIAVS